MRNSLHISKVNKYKLFTVSILIFQVFLALYINATTQEVLFTLYMLTSHVAVLLLVIPYFDRYIESKRPYARSNALRLNGGSHTEVEWYKLKVRFGHTCCKCQQHASKCGGLTKDHIIPLTLGGTDNIKNIQPLCQSCNSAKGAKIVDYR